MRHGMPRGQDPNLPLGVTVNDLPGNRPEDYALEVMVEELAEWLASEFDTVGDAKEFLDEQWGIELPDDMTEYDLIDHLVDNHEHTVRSMLGWDEDDRDDDLRDIQKDNEAMHRV